jgi:galactokinase/mevalonate kinase-like predicted kinase
MTFSTTIPRMVGLSGSSAIIVAAFKGLLRFYGLTIKDLNIEKTGTFLYFPSFHNFSNYRNCFFSFLEYPQVILNIEKEELGISAGLQDRVIQTYGGLVHMDFSRSEVSLSLFIVFSFLKLSCS